MTKKLRVTVAGAGIGGLAVASALAGQGHRVRVAERAAQIAEVGAGLQISPNGFRVMQALGLADALTKVSIQARTVRLIDGPSGRDVVTLDLSLKPDMAWHLVHRADLIDVLQTGAQNAGAQIDLGREVAPPSEGAALVGDDLLIGADGLKSAVRRGVDDARKPSFTGQVAWRAVIAGESADPTVEVHMGPGRHLVSYPLSRGRRNVVAVEERTAWADEGWRHQDDPANLRAAFSGFAKPVRDWLDQIDTVHLWGLFRHPVARRWYSGNQVLLGDAAHPTLPFLAQGANLAFEDAWVLARVLNEFPKDQAFARYQALRASRVSRVVDAATRNARNYHLSFPPKRFIGHTLMRFLSTVTPRHMLGRFDWLYDYDATKISLS